MVRALLWMVLPPLLAIMLALWLWQRPLPLPATPYFLEVPKGASLKQVAETLARDGMLYHPWQLALPARLQGQANAIKAGRYRFDEAVTTTQLLEKLVAGEVIPIAVTITEGITFSEFKRLLQAQPLILNTVLDMPDAQLLQAIGATETSPEGLFFSETYFIAAGSDDVTLLKTAYREMQARLSDGWSKRREGLPLASPYEALIVASIVEKETGMAADRPLVASVLLNRLRIGMRLQADPTVIYGISDAVGRKFNGRLRRRDLENDTPYNTYTRAGLPPTPIALVSQATLDAVLQAPDTPYLYFVSRNDGSGRSEFSETLDRHNQAVTRHIRRRSRPDGNGAPGKDADSDGS